MGLQPPAAKSCLGGGTKVLGMLSGQQMEWEMFYGMDSADGLTT